MLEAEASDVGIIWWRWWCGVVWCGVVWCGTQLQNYLTIKGLADLSRNGLAFVWDLYGTFLVL